jgi:IPT/TIG domain
VRLVPTLLVVAVLVASYLSSAGTHVGLRNVSCTYTNPAAIVTSVSPNAGPIQGGTTVTIMGSGFCNGISGVFFGSTPTAGGTLVSDTKIIVVSPAHGSGVVHITVVNASGPSANTPSDNYRYVSSKWCAIFDLSRVPTTWIRGHAKTFIVYATNCGTATWPASGSTRVNGNMHFTTRPGGSVYRSFWIGLTYHNLDHNIAPNRTATLFMSMSPTFSGRYYLEALMIRLHLFWFDQVTRRPAQYASVFITVARHA